MKKIMTFLFGLLLLAIPVEAGATSLRGDVDGDGSVSIADVTVLIDYLLSGDASAINLENAEVSGDGQVSINDVTMLIDYLLSGSWPSNAPQTETFTVNGVSFTMVIVEGGTFMMGATEEQGTTDPYYVEYPVHEVTLSTYSIGQTEVTQELWAAVMSLATDDEAVIYPSYFSSHKGYPYPDNVQRPVENMPGNYITIFLNKLKYVTGREFRLPTEAEWEFAARGGNLSKGYKYAGSNNLDEVAWYKGNIPSQELGSEGCCTQPVATKTPNELGLYDMSGNVMERVSDRSFYTYPSEPVTDPTYPRTNYSDVYGARGGYWYGTSNYCRVSRRDSWWEDYDNNHGIRLALTL